MESVVSPPTLGRPTQSDGAGWQLFTVWTLAATHMRDHLHSSLYIAMMDQILYLQVKPNMKHLGQSGRHGEIQRFLSSVYSIMYYETVGLQWYSTLIHVIVWKVL